MLECTGVPTNEELERVFPSKERLEKGPVVVVECFQRIPCNPCHTACRKNAIKEFDDINDLPVVEEDACNGCGLCVSKCPGLAIMVVDMTYSEKEAILKIPYEFLPLPEEGELVLGLDREGKAVGKVRVVKVLNTKVMDKTPVLFIAVKKEDIKKIRNIKLQEKEKKFQTACCSDSIEKNSKTSKDTVICRCSDVTLEQIRGLIKKGYTTFDEIKRMSRVGMGPCQSRNCGQLVLREVSQMTGTPISKLMLGTYRPPTKSIKLGEIAEAVDGGEHNG